MFGIFLFNNTMAPLPVLKKRNLTWLSILTSHNHEGLLFYRRRGTEEQRENKDKELTLIDWFFKSFSCRACWFLIRGLYSGSSLRRSRHSCWYSWRSSTTDQGCAPAGLGSRHEIYLGLEQAGQVDLRDETGHAGGVRSYQSSFGTGIQCICTWL